MTIGEAIGDRYLLKEELGAGGMGTVFRGVDSNTGAIVAVKLLKHDVSLLVPDAAERFKREAEALRSLNHPNIVKVLDTFLEDIPRAIVMEYVEGGTMYSLLDQEGRLSVKQTLEFALDIADALTRAHRLSIIHRDLKPANIMIASDGTPRLTDFGVARVGTMERVTKVGASVGTPDYMAPEALNGEVVDVRADIWAFGVLLFEMLTGVRPFVGDNLTQTITAILTHPTPDLETLRPDAPTALVDLIYRMLMKNRESRPPSVRVVGAEIEALLQGNMMITTTSIASVVPPMRSANADVGTRQFNTLIPSTSLPKHNLPAQTTPFVGRETELNDINLLLVDNDIRLITVLGPGGIGKTRLALQIATQQLDHYADGIYNIALAPLNDPSNLITAVGEAVDFLFQSEDRTPREQLLDYFREKHMLLVMDNFEHVLEAADFVAELLAAAPQINILVTSRERLNLSGETIYYLEGMHLPDEIQVQDNTTHIQGSEYSAIKLFVQAAKRARPGFEVHKGDVERIRQIIESVQAVPLGIILAAGWLDSLTLDEIIEEIQDSMDFLETEMRDVPERHRSMRAVFEYSWNLLTDKERKILVKLSLFRGGFDRDAARKVTGASLRDLTSLLNKSLLRRDPESGRYYPHLLIRQYAESRLDEWVDDVDAVYRTHADYYARMFKRQESVFNTKNEKHAIEAIEQELENMRVAWRWSLDHQHWSALDDMLQSILLFYLSRSMLMEGSECFCDVASTLEAQNLTDHPLHWRARIRESWMLGRIGDFERVWKLSKDAYDFFKTRDDHGEMIHALNNMSYARMMQSRYDEARDYAIAASGLPRSSDLAYTLFIAKGHHGYVEFLRGDYEEAFRIYNELNSLDGIANYSPSGRAFGLNNTGEIAQARGDLDGAAALYEEAYAIFIAYRHRRGMAFTLNNLAGVHATRGDFEKAGRIYHESYDLYREIGDRAGIGHSLSALGNMAFFSGDLEGAGQRYEEALAIRRQINSPRDVADSLADLADTAFAMDELDRAYQLHSESLELRREIGDQVGVTLSLTWLGGINGMLGGDPALTESYLEEAQQLAEQVGSPIVSGRVYLVRGELMLRSGNTEEAEQIFQHGLALARSAQSEIAELLALVQLASAISVSDDESLKTLALEIAFLAINQPRLMMTFMIATKVSMMIDRLTEQLPPDTVSQAEASAASHDIPSLVDRVLRKTT